MRAGSALGCQADRAGVLLIAMLWMVEGGPNLAKAGPVGLVHCLLLVAILLGFLVGWKWDGLGEVVSLGALIGFYLVELLRSGRLPGGWAFPSLAVPGVLFLLYSLAERSRRASEARSDKAVTSA